MFNSQTIYVLNRFDNSSIAYDDAYGKITLITEADFASIKEFRKWKNWDRMKKTSEQKKDTVHRNHTFSMTDRENEIGIVPSTEAVIIEEEIRAEIIQQAAESVKAISAILTEKQFRRIWLYYSHKYTLEQIAELEGTTHQAVSDSICRARLKLIKKFKP